RIVYQDVKGLENVWRKHHTSSVTRDIWIYDTATKQHTKLSPYKGEDLSPVFGKDDKEIYYLSEQYGSFNVVKIDPANPANVTQLTKHDKHPVRFLTITDSGDTLCYHYNGEIYTKKGSADAVKLKVAIRADLRRNPVQYKKLRSGATEICPSPDGKEVAFVARGEVFVTSTEYATTKRITNTPGQERSVSFSPDGNTLLYASEKDGSWNLYETTRVRKEELHFANSTLLKETPLLVSDSDTFQPKYSPNGKEVAFLENRNTLKVINLKSKATRTALDGKYNYSYADGDIAYNWSPDSNYFVLTYLGAKRWNSDIGLVDAKGDQKIVNLTKSGYTDDYPKWGMKGKVMYWATNRLGMRSHGSWGSQNDVYAMFFDNGAYDRFRLSKEDFEALKELEKKNKKKDKDKDKDKKDKKDKKDDKETVKPLKLDLENIDDRLIRLTINSSNLSDMLLSPDGETLYYLAKFEKGYDLWVNNLRKNETKLLMKLSVLDSELQMDKDGKNLFLISRGSIIKIDTKSKKRKNISYSAEFNLDKQGELAYLFEHVWRQTLKKFYDPNMSGLDWDFYKKEYARFLPHIDNNYDFAEMLSEILGELNASHTGSGHIPNFPLGDKTAKLGAYYDDSYTGKGLKIVEIMDKSPLTKASAGIKAGHIIEKIDGSPILPGKDYHHMLNRKAGKITLLSLFDPAAKKRWEVIVKPIGRRGELRLIYRRWVKRQRQETERLSKGRLGYVHVRSMNDASFRKVYNDMLGRYNDKEAIIVDTRFNGGGSLHEDLAKLLNGKKFFDAMPRGRYIGTGPRNQWYKPSIVLMGEGNYSNAHGFPYVYKKLGIGKLVGMPVAGTMTSVWWETLQDSSLYFGIPMVGRKDEKGRYLENLQLEPDYKVAMDPAVVVTGKDQQLEKAVEVLLETLNKK
ncbi:MAG: peptidase S41, partial [bacterium]|nr:peptidase S41 [bacterium]